MNNLLFIWDVDEVVIPAYDSIRAYSFKVGPSVIPFVRSIFDWLVDSFVRPFCF